MSGVSELNKQGLDRIEKVLNGKENEIFSNIKVIL